jgi:hypothetical protein
MSAFDFIEQSSEGSGFVYKNTTQAFVYSAATFTATTGTGTTVMNITEVTSGTVIIGMTIFGGTLTGTATIDSFGTFDGTNGTVNLSETQDWVNPTTVTANGFIEITDPDYPEETVRGIAYLDGTYYVMTPSGAIHGSELNNPFSWSALNVIQCQSEPDTGVALFRQLNLLVGFGDYSTEFFYDAANPTGSPLAPYTSSMLEMGCASADSIAVAENTLYFIAKGRQKGRSVYTLEGSNPKLVSNPYVDRILNADDLASVRSYFIKISGHAFYILTLGTSQITLVYDVTSDVWSKWTQQYLRTTLNDATFTWADGVVTMIRASHGLSAGDYIEVYLASPSGYNGTYVVNYVDGDTVTFELSTDPGTYVDSALVSCYDEVYFNMVSYVKAGNLDLVQDSTTGSVYALSAATYQDNGLPIKFHLRTFKVDNGNNKEKYFSKFELIGDKIDGTAYVRYSNDDYQTWSKYRPVDLDAQRSQLYRTGRGRRRAYEIINYDDALVRLEAMEITLTEGVR